MNPTLTLYVQTGCEFSVYVRSVLKQLGLTAVERNIDDAAISAELIKRGGKRQTPYLVDETVGIGMYESENLGIYLERTYGDGVVHPPVPNTNVCVPKELEKANT